ncbi:nucleolin isoform X2 [Eurytemora carolleeae]|uniref:nucleolin isoform X2 n=1 Tax=Eurytemora carolleeae TaxID=1294199 RepID=UPI000C791624|nr:nucleolin isoform X2 [Eurytemora carolleeae]|eukprot:XP_023320703.1 nucleolin-like isoform X2 [Eurytemora affinis]
MSDRRRELPEEKSEEDTEEEEEEEDVEDEEDEEETEDDNQHTEKKEDARYSEAKFDRKERFFQTSYERRERETVYSGRDGEKWQETEQNKKNEIYKKICKNIKHNLGLISANRKSTIMKDRQAALFSIIDSAINGPIQVSTEEASTVLGIKRETVEKVRKLSGLSKPGGARTENKYPSNGSMGSRSSSGSYPSSFPPAKTGVLHHLRDQFKIFSRLGDRRGKGKHITLTQSDKWLKQARVVDGRNITTVDTAILFKKMSKNNAWMNFKEWNNYVQQISEDLDLQDIHEALVLCGKPQLPITKFDTSSLTTRLTDSSMYGGTHRQRFDSNGHGRGMEGRRDKRDLPILWPTPSSNGFLITSPSAVPVGREGATSPRSPRKQRNTYSLQHLCPI